MKTFTYGKIDRMIEKDASIAVVFARLQGKWVLCRHKERTTWETPGGHREKSETILDAAKRELMEETGAKIFDITPVYSVSDGETSGIICFSEIHSLGSLPDKSEMAEVKAFDFLPESTTYPDLYKTAFDKVQGWLNAQSNAGEIWDIYDKDRNPTGRTHKRGDPLAPGDYHLVVHVWLKNQKGEYLITRRAPNKGYPNMWEATGGSALSGDDSLTAAIREVKEETGLTADPSLGKCIMSYMREDCFTDVWLFEQDFSLSDVVLQEGETTDKMYAGKEKINSLLKEGAFVPFCYLERLLNL